MKRIFKIIGIFLGGVIVGATLMNFLYMYGRSTYRDMIRMDLIAEQEYLAVQARSQGDKLRTISHLWNVVDAEAEGGFRAFRKEENKDEDTSFLFPFAVAGVEMTVAPRKERLHRYRQLAEGVARGKLALAYEDIDAKGEADKQWELALKLTNRQSIAELRQFIISLQEKLTPDLYLQAEKAVLRENSDKAQQQNQGDGK